MPESKWNGAKTTQNERRLCKKSFLTSLFSATHFLKGPSCLNSPGTPQQLFVTLRRQPNSTEKSVNATISCAEQRPFKTPQLPALRADVTGRRRHRRPRRLSCYTFRPPVDFQKHGNPPVKVGPIVGGNLMSSCHLRRKANAGVRCLVLSPPSPNKG